MAESDGGGLVRQHALLHLDAGVPQSLDAAPGGAGIGIAQANDDTFRPRGDDGIAAGNAAALMSARL